VRDRGDLGDLGLRSESFSYASSEVPQRLIANIEAREKEGKSTFALTAPDPIVVYNFDLGLEGIVQHAKKKGQTIIVAGVDQGRQRMPAYFFVRPKPAKGQSLYDAAIVKETAKRAREVWQKYRTDFREGLESKARSLVVDTGGQCFQLAKFARFGRLKRVLPRDHDELYQEFQQLMQEAYDYDKNVLWIHRLGEEWTDRINMKGEKESVKTGRWIRKPAYRDVGFEVQANVRLEKYLDKKKQAHFKATVTDCRLNQGMDGLELEDDLCSFPYLAAAIFEGEPEEWGKRG